MAVILMPTYRYCNCIGQNFAMNEEKIVIASKVILDKTHKVEELILCTKNDVKMTSSMAMLVIIYITILLASYVCAVNA